MVRLSQNSSYDKQLATLLSRVGESTTPEQREKRLRSVLAYFMSVKHRVDDKYWSEAIERGTPLKNGTITPITEQEVIVDDDYLIVPPTLTRPESKEQISQPKEETAVSRGIPIVVGQARGGMTEMFTRPTGGQAEGSRLRRYVLLEQGNDIWLEVVDSNEIERIQLSLTPSGGKILCTMKEWEYQGAVQAFEHGPNE